MHRERTTGRHRQKASIHKSRGEASEEANLLIPWSQTSSLQNCEEIHFHCLRHPVSGICYGALVNQLFPGKESACQCWWHRFSPWLGEIPWRTKWQPIPVLLPGNPMDRPQSMESQELNIATEQQQSNQNTGSCAPYSSGSYELCWTSRCSMDILCVCVCSF